MELVVGLKLVCKDNLLRKRVIGVVDLNRPPSSRYRLDIIREDGSIRQRTGLSHYYSEGFIRDFYRKESKNGNF